MAPKLQGNVFDGNAAAFGSEIASEASQLQVILPYTLVASSGSFLPRVTVIIQDELNQTVASSSQLVSANPSTLLGGVLFVQAVNGIAVFDDLIVRSGPNTSFDLSFSLLSGTLTSSSSSP